MATKFENPGFARIADEFTSHLIDGEQLITIGSISPPLLSLQLMPSALILTNFRLVQWGVSGVIRSIPLGEIESHRLEYGGLGKVLHITVTGEAEEKLGSFNAGSKSFNDAFEKAMIEAGENTKLRTETPKATANRYSKILTNRISSKRLPAHLVKSIQRNSRDGEDPVMIITGSTDSTDGSLIVYEDRCVISKSGAIGGLMAAATGGGRDATFFLKDITGIEYNSGLLTGVLEILTPSYSGGDTKDFWGGLGDLAAGAVKSAAQFNLAGMNPRVSSNTLPLIKSDYLKAKPLIDKFRKMVQDSKAINVNVTSSPGPAGGGVADEIAKFANLLEQGLITQNEFDAAKAKLLGM